MAAPTPPLEVAIDAIVGALRASIPGVERHYPPPTAAHVIRDAPQDRAAWDNQVGVRIWVFPAAVIGETQMTRRAEDLLLITILAGKYGRDTRPTDLSGDNAGAEPWAVKARLAADVIRQLEAATANGLIPSTALQDWTHQANFDIANVNGWDVVQVLMEVRQRRDRTVP